MASDPPPPYPGQGQGEMPYPPPGAPQYDQMNKQPCYYPPPPMQPGTGPSTVYMQQPQMIGATMTTTAVMVGMPMVGPYPVNMVCPRCQAQIVTETRSNGGLLAWLICGGLALIGCWLGCCLIPFCVDECQDVEHHCPNCKQFINTYRRI